MIEQVTEKRVVTEEKDVVVGEKIICDCCGKIIYDNTKDKSFYLKRTENKEKNIELFGYGARIKYYSLTTGHHDWGNDSCESVETKDLCSKECLLKSIDEFVDNNEYSTTLYFDATTEAQYFKFDELIPKKEDDNG